ncbi:MAG: beta-galactosidase [Bacteroidales bacterium]|nr:beta-galactosidase [Bacteroidales bacterium]
MNLRLISAALILAAAASASAWSPVGGHISTTWAETVTPENVWQEYPRPIMERQQWKNLNGLWQYAIVPAKDLTPGQWQGEILVPFAVESSLSGVGKNVGKDQALWYTRTFTVPSDWKGQDVMLNFGAVDWQCEVWVNDVKVGGHTGGFTPFSLNITPALKAKGENTLTVRVYDPTDAGYQPRGKQVANPEGIWYTPVTGIWQTVWMEPVAKTHIAGIRTTPDIDRGTVTVDVTATSPEGTVSEVAVLDGGKVVATGKSVNGEPVKIAMPEGFKLWSPDAPNIYDLQVTLYNADGKVADKVNSYTAMRKFSRRRDANGIMRLQLNNQDLFQFGPLDQGWWPDGLYTAPSYEAMVYDVDKTKDWGFNMIRKHVKVEPASWYTYCDKNGIIVWQDMPSGDRGPGWNNRTYFTGYEGQRSEESKANYRREWKEIMDALYNYPCVGVWVPFNESWGQFDTPEVVEWTMSYDPTRMVNPASGGNFFQCGDILDLHNYPGPDMYLYDAQRVNALGEFGGIGYPIEGHLWQPDRNWGYIQFDSPKAVTDEYVKYAKELRKFADKGFSAAVYTQTTDVEGEVNGLMTYDRKVIKVEEPRIKEANEALTNSLPSKK